MAITITIRKDGPYLISGDDVAQVKLVDHEGNAVVQKGKNIALCRCGASSTKPFCDGTHSKIGFRGAEEAAAAFDAGHGAPPATDAK
jgi:CDGSH-type Zn-finger protein